MDRALETEVEKYFRQRTAKMKKNGASLRGAIGKKARKDPSGGKAAGFKKGRVEQEYKNGKRKGEGLCTSTPSQAVGPMMAKLLARNKALREKKRKMEEDLLVGELARMRLDGARQKPLGWAVEIRRIRKRPVAYGCGPRCSTSSSKQ